ncbi:MAG: cytochrome [Actinomycetia bacterium]|nr:cytochrome [Actinomycetes bacterium]
MSTVTETPDDLLRSAMLTEAGRQDPYAILDDLHEHGEAANVSLGYTAVWGYNAVNGVLRTPGLWKTHPDYELSTPYLRLTPEQVEELKAASGHLPPWLVFSNPPYHTRLRALVSKAFTPKRMDAMRDQVADEVTRLLDAIDPTKPVDIVGQLTAPLPQYVSGELIGLSVSDAASFVRHSREQSLLKDPKSTFEDKLDKMRDRKVWADEIRDLIADRRREAKDDIITALLDAEQEGDRLTEPEMISLIMLLFAAGFDTSNNMMANGIHALLRHPDQMAILAQDPSLARRVTEEVLRYDTPGFDTFYYAVGEQKVADIVVPDGAPIVLFLGIANHDPGTYTDPRKFWIERDEPGPLSFGAGSHLCLGINLARLEGELVFAELATRFPNMTLAEADPPRIPDVEFRGFQSMQVLLQP